MQINKIGIKNRYIIPAVMSIPLIVTSACGGKSEQNNIPTEPQNNEYKIPYGPQQDEYIAQAPKKSKGNGILFPGAGFLVGLGLVGTISKVKERKDKIKLEKEVKEQFYKNNPSINNFEPIKGEKELALFVKRRNPLYGFYASIVNIPPDLYSEQVDVEDYMKKVFEFTKYYPDRKKILIDSIKSLSDVRLAPEERAYVFLYMLGKGISTDEEWGYNYEYIPLNSCASYDDIVHRIQIKHVLEMAQSSQTRAESEEDTETEAATKGESRRMSVSQKSQAVHKISFKDVGGQDKAIDQLKKGILYPVKYPEAFSDTNLEHGFVLYGPPGTGKTLLAKALSNEADAHFIKIDGPELESKWVGETEENWRKIFDEARQNEPSIIFIDEFDSIASKRGKGDIYGDKALNQLLALISDIRPDEQIFIIAATNRLDNIDPAFIRSGRLGTHIELKSPDTEDAVRSIFEIHIAGKKIDKDVNKNEIAKELFKLRPSGADIAHIVNEARENTFTRLDIYKKMDDDTLTKSDIANITINTQDFLKAIEDFNKKKFSKTPIGFGK